MTDISKYDGLSLSTVNVTCYKVKKKMFFFSFSIKTWGGGGGGGRAGAEWQTIPELLFTRNNMHACSIHQKC